MISVFHGTPAIDIKLIVGHTNNRSAKRALTHTRPNMKLLNPKKKPSENGSPLPGVEAPTEAQRLSLFNLEP